ncbi:MAG: glyoxalase [Sphingobium sp. 66-54]|nr:MAG: glyoxalase [Sphingobium sp. 66-54]
MTNKHGEFIWYELMTTDLDAARAFYGPVVGWAIGAASGMPGMDYRMIDAPDASVGGMMAIDDDMAAQGMKPLWIGYIGVDDVDATAAAIKEHGGRIHVPPTDIPDVGRFAMASDPQGAPFYVMRGSVEGTSTAFSPDAPGHCCWNELATSDQDKADAFYAAVFGWTNPESMPMGPMGDYRFLYAGDIRIGASMRGEGAPRWQPYFTVPSIAAAIEAVKAHGGRIDNGPHEVPGGNHIIVGTDPQGVRFALAGGA